MSKKINVSVTGFYGTGSGAVMDLLKEYDGAQMVPYPDIPYEHIPFYFSGGLFDLCAVLTRGNSLFTSDRAIDRFLKAMHKLNDYDYLWFGSYKKIFGTEFMDLCEQFVSEISTKRKGTTINHIERSRFSPLKAGAQLGLKLLKGREVNQYGIHYVYDGNEIYSALPTEEEFYAAAKKFTSGYMALFDRFTEGDLKIFDHLIWAPEIDAYKDCFTDDVKTIVVDRDPRDIYLLDQHVWNEPPLKPKKLDPHFPTDIDDFVKEWKRMMILPKENPNALSIHFEDLVYDYDATVQKIEKFLEIPLSHTKKKEFFDNAVSIENTQLFLCNNEWAKAAETLREKLPEYIYHFPYERKPDQEKMFA